MAAAAAGTRGSRTGAAERGPPVFVFALLDGGLTGVAEICDGDGLSVAGAAGGAAFRTAASGVAASGTVACGTVACGTVACGTVACGTVACGAVARGTVAPGTVAPRTVNPAEVMYPLAKPMRTPTTIADVVTTVNRAAVDEMRGPRSG